MDDSSQNDQGVQQPETENSAGYQKYLDPAGKPKKKKTMVIIALAVAAVLLIVIGVVLALSSDNQQNPSENAGNVPACSDQECAESHFTECSPAEYAVESADISSVRYRIVGPAEVGCSTEVEYLSSKYTPELAGKKMICEFDNTISFSDAVRNIFLYTDDYNCQGELAAAINNLDSTNEP